MSNKYQLSIKKVVYRLIKHSNSFYSVDCQTWLSANKDVSDEQYNIFNLGEFPSYNQAQNALHGHASLFPAYTFISAGYKSNAKHLTVYESQDFFKSSHADIWFEETAAHVATEADTGAAASPSSNTGGLNKEKQSGLQTTDKSTRTSVLPHFISESEAEIQKLNVSETYTHQYFEQGVLKTLMLRRGIHSPAFIDTLSFTILESSFHKLDDNGQWITGEPAVLSAIREVTEAMGIGVVKEAQGRNGYLYGLQFGDEVEKRNFSFVCWGGDSQNGSVMFHFTGEGLTYAVKGWENNL